MTMNEEYKFVDGKNNLKILTKMNTGLIYFQHSLQNSPGRCPIIFSISLAKLSVPYTQQTPAASTKTTKRMDSPGP